MSAVVFVIRAPCGCSSHVEERGGRLAVVVDRWCRTKGHRRRLGRARSWTFIEVEGDRRVAQS
jgi:hypothetical protein